MATKQKAAVTKEPDGAPVPTKIKLTCPYAVYDDDGQLRSWAPGAEITDAADIEYLTGVGAEHIDISE